MSEYQEEVVQDMASRHDIDLDQARAIVLGYEPEPGTAAHAWGELADSLRELMDAVSRAIRGAHHR